MFFLSITMDRMKSVCSWKVDKITKLTNYTKFYVLQIVGFISILRFVVRRVACTLTSGAARFVDHSEVCCEWRPHCPVTLAWSHWLRYNGYPHYRHGFVISKRQNDRIMATCAVSFDVHVALCVLCRVHSKMAHSDKKCCLFCRERQLVINKLRPKLTKLTKFDPFTASRQLKWTDCGFKNIRLLYLHHLLAQTNHQHEPDVNKCDIWRFWVASLRFRVLHPERYLSARCRKTCTLV